MWLLSQEGIKGTGAELLARLRLLALLGCFAALNFAAREKLVQLFPVRLDFADLERLRLAGRGIVFVLFLRFCIVPGICES